MTLPSIALTFTNNRSGRSFFPQVDLSVEGTTFVARTWVTDEKGVALENFINTGREGWNTTRRVVTILGLLLLDLEWAGERDATSRCTIVTGHKELVAWGPKVQVPEVA